MKRLFAAAALWVLAAAPGLAQVPVPIGGGSSGFPITIGSTSIAAGATTTALTGLASLGITAPAANSVPLTISGGSTTGSSTSGLGINISGTLDTTNSVPGAGLFANITNTASGVQTSFLDIQNSGTDWFVVTPNINSYVSPSNSLVIGPDFAGLGAADWGIKSLGYLYLVGTAVSLDYSNSGSHGVEITDSDGSWITQLYADGASNALGQRNGTNAQTLRVYNTYTSSTNYEAAEIDWQGTTNVLSLGTIKGSGGGNARALQLVYGGTNELDFAETNAGEWTFQAPLLFASLPTGTPNSYACFTSSGELISSSTAC